MKLRHLHIARIQRTWLIPIVGLFFSACLNTKPDTSLLVSAAPSVFEDVLLVEGEAQSVRSTIIPCPEDIEADIVFIAEDGATIDSGQVVCILESKEMESNYESILLQLESFKAALTKSEVNLDMQYALLEAQVRSLDAQTAIANLDSLQLIYASPTQRRLKELEMQRAAIERTKLTNRLNALGTINASEMKKQALQIKRVNSYVDSYKEQLEQLTLRAPQSGLVIRSDSWLTGEKLKQGDQASSGMPLILLPDPSRMKVVIQATETQFKQLNLNDSIEFTFDAMPGNKAWGRITSLMPIGRPLSRRSKVRVFDVEALVDSALTLPEPGISANCRIFLRRLPNVIVLPQLAIFDVDSIKVVYVQKGRTYERQQVITGATSPKLAVILAGLTGEEQVSLLKPQSSAVKRIVQLPDSIISKYTTPALPTISVSDAPFTSEQSTRRPQPNSVPQSRNSNPTR